MIQEEQHTNHQTGGRQMKKVYKNILEVIGATPLVEVTNIEEKYQIKARILAKLEYLNPTGSVKDRAAKKMIEEAEASGELKPGYTIIEATSGNTGIGLASIATIKKYPLILTMPETMSVERRNILKAYGAQLVLTDGAKGMNGAIEKAQELKKQNPNSFIPAQFDNQANAKAHQETTGPEIWNDTEGDIDIFIAGVGTGGTITGAGRYLKEKNPQIKVIAVEPKDSPMLSEGKRGAHKIQGMGAGFVPAILDTKIYDEVIKVSNEESFAMAKEVGKLEGILVGISAGAILSAAIEVAKREENRDKKIVVIFPDSGDRYYSTPLFEEE